MPRRRTRSVTGGRQVLITLLLAVALTGCVGAIDRSDFDAEVQRRGGGVTTALLSEPLAHLREELGVDDPQLLSLYADPGDRVVTLEVRDPRRDRNVDRYHSYGGGLDDPDPVQVSASDDLDARSFHVSDVPALGDLETVADTAIDALGFTDSYVDSIAVRRTLGETTVVLEVTSPRASGSATFAPDGTLIAAVPA